MRMLGWLADNCIIFGSQTSSARRTLSDENKVRWAAKISEFLPILQTNLAKLDSSDTSIYTGLVGIALFYHRLSRDRSGLFQPAILKDAGDCARQLLTRSKRHLPSSSSKGKSRVSCLAGPITGALLLVHLVNQSSSTSRHALIAESVCCSSDNEATIPDEALYGRTGYLLALLSLDDEPPADVIRSVVQSIIASGLTTAQKYRQQGIYDQLMSEWDRSEDVPQMPPLFYEWHEKAYLGAAHGFAGILLTLLKVHIRFPTVISTQQLNELVLPTINWLAKLQLGSGNWPSSLGSSMNRDKLVQWCHGSPGIIPLMLLVHKISPNNGYLDRALKAGDDVWKRGLLKKGCGLCHGTAGNGYALLSLYRATKDSRYLYRAAKFADHCTDYRRNQTRQSDRPYSLFEGLSGALYFLLDMIDPDKAAFPLLNEF